MGERLQERHSLVQTVCRIRGDCESCVNDTVLSVVLLDVCVCEEAIVSHVLIVIWVIWQNQNE